MRRKNKIKIILSLLLAVCFVLTSISVIGKVGNNLPTEKENATAPPTTTGQMMRRAQIGRLDPNTATMTPLDGNGPFPVQVTDISLGGINQANNTKLKTGRYPLDVTVCQPAWPQDKDCSQNGSAQIKKFIEVYQKKTIPGTPDTTVSLYCENFETPCEIYTNWSKQDMAAPGYNGAFDTWTWSTKRYESPGHSMHCTSFDQYLANQWDILELGFGGTGINVSKYSVINITWWQWIQGDTHDTGNGTIIIQDYGYFQYSFDEVTWTQADVQYYNSNGAWQKINLKIDNAAHHVKAYFRWVWKSDPLFCYEGWYIDDVCITGVIPGTPAITTWVFVMDSHSWPQWIIPPPCETYTFPEAWAATEGTYKICAWIEALDACHMSITPYNAPYCIYITIGNILDLALDCNSLSWTPDSPAFEGNTVNTSINVCNDGTLNAWNVQVQMMVQRGTFEQIGTDDMERNNVAMTGLLPGRLDPGTDLQWVRSITGSNGTMSGQIRSYTHYTTYDKTQGTKALANFQENGTTAYPFYYHNYQSVNDYARGPLQWVVADKSHGITATFDLTVSIGATDKLEIGVWDYSGSGYMSYYYWTGPTYFGWSKMTIPVSTLINNIASYATPDSKYCLTVYHIKVSPFTNHNAANPRDAQWSGWMMDNIVYTALVAQPTSIWQQTNIIPYINITNCVNTKFSWTDAGVGRYVLTYTILTSDADSSNNKCNIGYDVINVIIPPTNLICVDNTGLGASHWIEEGCCGGYLWDGDPVTTFYGNNWSDCLYLKNGAGGITFNLSSYASVTWQYDNWFQFNGNDKGLVQYSLDGGKIWTTVTTWTGYSAAVPGASNNGWFNDIHGIGTSTMMQFRFVFQSNASLVNRGWLLDNITVFDGSTILFGPDPCENLSHFYQTQMKYGCWWNTPDQYGYTPGYGCFDPAYPAHSPASFVGIYPDNLDCSLIWTLNIPQVFYGFIDGSNFADLGPNDFAYMDISNDSGATWKNLEFMSGSPQPDYPFGTVYVYNGPYDLAKYIGNQIQIRWRLTSDSANAIPYVGPGFEDMNFYGMQDVHPPVTTLTMTGTYDETYNYYTSAVKMKLTATDDITGVAHTYYKLDGETHEYTGIVTISTDGTHTFCYWSVDVQGNVDAEQCVLPFRIDLTGPTVTITGPATGALYLFGNHLLNLKSGKTIFLFGGIPVTANATTTGAPVKAVQFYLDDVILSEDTTAPYSATLSTKHKGPAVIKVTASDVLGHITSATLNINIYFKLI